MKVKQDVVRPEEKKVSRVSLNTRAIISTVGLAVIIACALLYWLAGYHPLRSVTELPKYPNSAKEVTVDETTIKTLQFETVDKPEDIRAYYKDVLTKDGWKWSPGSQGPLGPPGPTVRNVTVFDWYGPGNSGGYVLLLTIETTGAKKSRVEVRVALDPGR